MRATSEEIAIFVAVVESGSFSRAAEQLGQANSAVNAHDAAGLAAGGCRDAGDAAFSHAAGEAVSRALPGNDAVARLFRDVY